MKPRPRLRIIGRYSGRGLLILSIMLVGAELFRALERGAYKSLALGEVWYLAHSGSLNALQAGVQRYLDPALWDTGIAPLLFLPAWIVFLVPGVVLAFLCRPKQPTNLWL